MSTINDEPIAIEPVEDEQIVERPPGRRRKKILLIILAVLAVIFMVVLGWYLLTRKPLTALPGISQFTEPAYATSLYGVKQPIGVAATQDGDRIYVTESEAPFLTHVFDGSGAEVGTLAPPESTGKAHLPAYVAVDPTTDEVYVSDRFTQSVYIYDASGEYVRTFDPGQAIAKSWQPLALAFDAQGHLYVSDVSGEQTLREFAPDGSVVREIGTPGDTSFVNGIVVDGDGNVVVSDSNNGRVVIYDPQGVIKAQVNRGASDAELSLPRGIALEGGSTLVVADAINQQVQVYDIGDSADGAIAYLATLGSEGTGDGQFLFPNGAAADAHGRIYVTDRVNNRVQVWRR